MRRGATWHTCAITFDDGWRDNWKHAVPELERRGLPATVFVVSERVRIAGAFWPDELLRRLDPLPATKRRDLAQRLGPTIPAILRARSSSC